MENNIFVKIKRDKFNPDVENKLKGKETERTNTKFNLTKSIYNPITGIIPSQIQSNNDLILNKDCSYSVHDIKKLIMDKESERIAQDKHFKPIKTKVINNNLNIIETTNTNTNTNTNTTNRTNYIQTYEELKKGSNDTKNEHSKNINQNKEKYNNILDGLKDLGIIR